MNEENNNEQIASVFEVRKEKLAQIKALGDIPYKDRGRRDASIREILNERYGQMEIDDKYGKLARASKDAFILKIVYMFFLQRLHYF